MNYVIPVIEVRKRASLLQKTGSGKSDRGCDLPAYCLKSFAILTILMFNCKFLSFIPEIIPCGNPVYGLMNYFGELQNIEI